MPCVSHGLARACIARPGLLYHGCISYSWPGNTHEPVLCGVTEWAQGCRACCWVAATSQQHALVDAVLSDAGTDMPDDSLLTEAMSYLTLSQELTGNRMALFTGISNANA